MRTVSSIANLADARPVGKGTVATTSQNKGQAQLGSELATRVWSYIKADGSTLREYCRDILNLDNAGRVEFRKMLNAKKADAKTYADALAKGDKLHRQMTGGQIRTAFVRVSELMTVSRAGDKGITPQAMAEAFATQSGIEEAKWENLSFANIVSTARVLVGKKEQGRKTASTVDKVKKYLLSTYNPKEFAKIAKVALDLAKQIHSVEEAKAELESMKPKKAAKVAEKAAA